MNYSRAHLGSELQVTSAMMAGVDNSTVAYFPLLVSPADTVSGIIPYGAADYSVSCYKWTYIKNMQYMLSDLRISADNNWSLSMKYWVDSTNMSSYLGIRKIPFCIGDGTRAIYISTGASSGDLGTTLPRDFVIVSVISEVETYSSCITPSTAGFGQWWTFCVSYDYASKALTLRMVSDTIYTLSITEDLVGIDTSNTSKVFIASRWDNTEAMYLRARDIRVNDKVLTDEEVIAMHRYSTYNRNERLKLL